MKPQDAPQSGATSSDRRNDKRRRTAGKVQLRVEASAVLTPVIVVRLGGCRQRDCCGVAARPADYDPGRRPRSSGDRATVS